MQTRFTEEQLKDAATAHSEKILRKCVHCGFCTATCPTYLTLGDELDSPRGRIYLIKDMLENGRPADARTVKHIDRCLSCLACMTTCPSGVHYMHLVDHARAHIQETYKRPMIDRLYRWMLAQVLPYPERFRFALSAARLGKPFAGLIKSLPGTKPMAAMLALAPSSLPKADRKLQNSRHAPQNGSARGRVVMMQGCAQRILDPAINLATINLLTRLGYEVLTPPAEGCCGALVHHMGREAESHKAAKRNIDAWLGEADKGGLDAIIITTSGCGTTVKDYAHMLREDAAYADKAAEVSGMAKDITEFLADIDLPQSEAGRGIRLAYHSACSMQHGQKITTQPKKLLADAGFTVVDVPEGHLCCGSAGTYNILQPDIASQLKDRKIANIKRVEPEIIAAGNIGCITQIASGTDIPIVHTAELLNWAHGGTMPQAVKKLRACPG
ncbi:glycolate oxidase subunit GlcF [Salaquimonas pukyongi]|uniref:glycolate oxidase subunit GlcF n=1 Tax=Salaquimonas pukyongi TaxID=2712698 RepID=UPI00096B71E1|nr:glycolate oxidase subunit GlcF [Salaquimonas pukyongi]